MNTNTENYLSCVEITTQEPAKASVIWLHGLGADGNDFVPIVPELNLPSSLGIRFIFPHAPSIPVTINNSYEMRAWYDISSLMLDRNIDAAGIMNSRKLIEKLIQREEERGIATTNIILAGFSQGAVMALNTGLHYSKPLAGLLILSGYLPFPENLIPHTDPANLRVPIFIGHGTEDPIVPYSLGKASYVALSQAGYTVAWHSYPIPHSVCAEEVADISKWMQEVIR